MFVSRLRTAAWHPCAVLTRQPRALNIIATTSRMAVWKSTTKTLKGTPSTKSWRSFRTIPRIDACSFFLLDATGSRAAWLYGRPVTACRCAGDSIFTIPHLPGMWITIRLPAASPLRFFIPGLRPLFVQHPAVVFFYRPPLVRRGQAIFAPGTCASAVRNGFPEAVRIAFETLDGPNKVRYIRHGGAFGFIFSFFGTPIRKSRIRSLRSHRTVCRPEWPAATPSF